VITFLHKTIAILAVACLASCSYLPELPRSKPFPNQLVTKTRSPDYVGIIKSYEPRSSRVLLLTADPKKYPDDKLYVEWTRDTYVYSATSSGYITVATADLRAGHTIEVLFDLELGTRASYPGQVYATEVLISK
jgi:hypothetical protein